MAFGTSTTTNQQSAALYVTASALNAKGEPLISCFSHMKFTTVCIQLSGQLRRAFSVWKCATVVRINEQTCLSSAEMFHTSYQTRKYLLAWKYYQHCQLRKKVIYQQRLVY